MNLRICSHDVRRATAIIAVLMLLVMGIIIAATVLVTADAARATSHAEMQRVQSRALGWSGIQALMVELAEQREDLLDGEEPDITAEWDLFTLDDGTRGVVRLIDLVPEGVAIIAAENAKLDINTATAEMLVLIPGLDESSAAAIIQARENSPFSSVAQLLRVEGITPQLLYGTTIDATLSPDTESASLGLSEETTDAEGLQRYLTVFSFDPNVQVGFDGETESRGNLRINLDQAWSERLGRAIANRFDQNAANLVKTIMEAGQSFATDSDLVGALVTGNLPLDQWATVLDVFTTTDDQFLPGRIDINRASPEVLSCIPGVSPQAAEQIVEAREGLDTEMRRSPTWLVVEGLLSPEEYIQAADWITTRSMQWRVKLEVGLESGDSLGGFDEEVPLTLEELNESYDSAYMGGRLSHRMVFEAVLDIGSTRPRVAYLREVTLFDPVYAMHRAARAAEEEERSFDPFEELPELESGVEPGGSESPEENPLLSGVDDFDFDFGDPLDEGLEASTDEIQLPDPMPDSFGTSTETDEVAGDEPDMIDRRIGRWSTRKAGES